MPPRKENFIIRNWLAIVLVISAVAVWSWFLTCECTKATTPVWGELLGERTGGGIVGSQEIADEDFAAVQNFIPDIHVDLRYAGENNITGTVIYDFDTPYLRYGTVKKLQVVQDNLRSRGYSLKIWDGFRPTAAQFDLWGAMPDSRYIANPNRGFSNHSRGNCVDLTLVTTDGGEVAMPTDFDDFTLAADRDYGDVSTEAAANARILEEAMVNAGFEPYQAEWWHYTDTNDYPVDETFDPAAAEEGTITLSAVGDCILANGYGFNYPNNFADYAEREGFDYFFSRVDHILAQDDLTVANAENVFTTAEERVNKEHQGNRAYWFKSDPEYAEIFTAGSVEAVNVANNHSHDYGEVGFQDSLKALDGQGIATFGYGDIEYYQVKGYTVALLGYNVLGPVEQGVDIDDLKEEIAADMEEAKENGNVVVVSFHWGEEGVETANEEQVDLAHYTADLGADVILGHHPHVLQEVEVYGDTIIGYSLGNFVYGGSRTPSIDTMILSVTMDINPETGAVTAMEYQEIPGYVHGGTEYNNYQPVLRLPTKADSRQSR